MKTARTLIAFSALVIVSVTGWADAAYDAVEECFKMRNKYIIKDDIERKLDKSSATRQLFKDTVEVRVDEVLAIFDTTEILRGGGELWGTGKFICEIDDKGRVVDNYQLCSTANDEDVEKTWKQKFDTGIPKILLDLTWVERFFQENASIIENIRILGDLNGDGIPELIDKSSDYCGSINCHYPVYLIDVNNENIKDIGEQIGVDGAISILRKKRNGWNMLKKIECAVGNDCYCYLQIFDSKKNEYVIREKYKILSR